MMDGLKSGVCDLAQLSGPLSTERLVRVIKKHFQNQNYMFMIGSVLISINPFTEPLLPRCLTDSASDGHDGLKDIVYQAVNKLKETCNDQAIVLSGESGSGKTYYLYHVLNLLYEGTGCGVNGRQTDLYKHVCATFTVLQPLCTASTTLNRTSSRVGLFVQNFMSRDVICRTKLNCFFLDHGRMCNRAANDSNYSIFYQMLTGMTQDEKVKYCLLGYDARNLRYLNNEAITDMPSGELSKARFLEWKYNLCILGICVSDVLRTLSAALLLGNITFLQSRQKPELQLDDSQALYAVSDLLGISPTSLYMALVTPLSVVRGVTVNKQRTPTQAERVCDSLAKALYARTVISVIGKANSLCKMSHKGTKRDRTPDDKHDSHTGTEVSISIVDMCGFENLQRTGILSMLNAECRLGSSSRQSFMAKLWSHHNTGNSFFEATSKNPDSFLIRHFAGSVAYNSSDIIMTNQDILPTEMINLFNEHNCSCGFVRYLFPPDEEKLQKSVSKTNNKPHRILHKFEHQKSIQGGHGTIAETHRYQLDQLIKTLLHLEPHFIKCIKSNDNQRAAYFNNDVVLRQIASLQIMPTLKLFTSGLPHKARYKYFIARYHCLTCKGKTMTPSYAHTERCEELLDAFLKRLDESSLSYSNIHWALGTKHIFLSEVCYRHLEAMREETRSIAVQCIQTAWRMYGKVKDEYSDQKTLITEANCSNKCDPMLPSTDVRPFPEHILNTCTYFGLSCNQPSPPLPPLRMYTVANDYKLSFPQERFLKRSYKGISGTMTRGQAVPVIGPSPRPEHMLVDLNGEHISIPHTMLIIQNPFHHDGIT